MSNLTTNTSLNMFEIMDKAYKFAEIMAKSDIIPMHYRGKPANVFIALQTAYRMNLDPMLIMQNTYTIAGKLGMNTSFAIALANNSGLFTSGMRYKCEGEGNNLKVTAYVNLKKTNEEISYTVTMKEAEAENWTKNTKYKTLPELMLRYRAATLLIRTHAPEVMNGMHMVEELEDITASKGITPKTQSINNRLDNLLNTQVVPMIDQPEQMLITDSRDKLNELISTYNVSDEIVSKWCDKASVSNLQELDEDKIQSCIVFIENNWKSLKINDNVINK